MKVFLVVLAIVITTIAFILMDKCYRRFCIARLMKKRQCLTHKEMLAFYELTDFSPTDILERWFEVADILGVSAGYLRPSDQLNKIVTLSFFTDDRVEDISDRAIELNKILGLSLELEMMRTLDDYITAFSSKNVKPSDTRSID